jgi:DNA (cytosine-5)-methyltransferase 1
MYAFPLDTAWYYMASNEDAMYLRNRKEGRAIKHLGDITKLNGAEIPAVDVITGGSPCQDLSVAGKRAGLKHEDHGDEETTRSGLFMDQVRIVKEMRENDIRHGRTGESVRPRYMVWENVPGAFSSNQGEDFRAVLEEIIKIVEPEAPILPMPEKGRWPNAGCIYDELGKWSVAWRVHDAQYWGVAQRRRRISLLADFAGTTAPWIMFEPEYRRTTEDGYPDETLADTGAESRSQVQSVGESLPGYSEPRGTAWEEIAGSIGESTESAGGSVETICLEGNGSRESHFGNGYAESDVMYTLNTIEQHGVLPIKEPIVLESNQNHATVTDEGISPTLSASMGMGGGYVPMITEPKAISFQERAGKPGGGKGILIQEEHTGALSTLTIQHVLSLETYHCESDEDTAMTLKARDYKDPQSVLCVSGEDHERNK